ncbi:Inner membrane protein YiaV precursor [Rubripirellula amarantea]|uniref:Inner membrane protein YiaV n=2 Tax=Rubripirellula amarantea TaxID=2527999 RepID=A0A5C5WKE5_9BACT|nr:Inner membrane protein YiaV precursor [Rubripirellula amarantea]
MRLAINVIVSICLFAGCFVAYSKLGKRERPERIKRPKLAGTVVTTEQLKPHNGPVVLSANGVVVPLREIRLSTEVAGRVIELSANVRNGRKVTEGEILMRLDPTEFELEIERLRAQQAQEAAELDAIAVSIENTSALLTLSRDQLTLSSDELARVESLVNRRAASTSEVDVAKRAQLTAKAALVELENRRRDLIANRELVEQKRTLTEVAIKRGELDLRRTVVTAPVTGRVIESLVEEQSFVAVGTPFVTIEDNATVEVRSNLTVDQMYRIWNSSGLSTDGLAADDRVPAVPATIQYRLGQRVYQWQAVLERIDGAGIDAATRTYPCLFRVDDPQEVRRLVGDDVISDDEQAGGPGQLMRGMFVSVLIQTQSQIPLVQCSELAIRPGNQIWLDVDGKLRIVNVEVVASEDDYVIIDPQSLPVRSTDESVSVIVSPVSDPIEGMALIPSKKPDARNVTPESNVADEAATSKKAAG